MAKFALDNRGGGQALPPFLQGRTPAAPSSPFQTQPIITPKAMVSPGEVKPGVRPNQPPAMAKPGQFSFPQRPMAYPTAAPTPSAVGTPPPAAKPQFSLYDFLKQDLEAEQNKALAGANTDAESRGVFYGSPLTTSRGDIKTEFLRGLGQLDSGLIQNERQNELARLGMATNLIGSPPSFGDLASLGQGNPDIYSIIGSLFAGPQGQTQRPGPAITPNNPLPANYNPNAPNYRR